MKRFSELLDRIKQQQGISSNYALAKVLQVEEKRIHDYYKGMVKPDDYAITRVALMLHIEPIHLLAEIRSEDEKNATKREFWRNFLRHAAVVAASAGALTLGLASTSEAGASTAKDGRLDVTANYALWRRLSRWAFGRFSTPILGV